MCEFLIDLRKRLIESVSFYEKYCENPDYDAGYGLYEEIIGTISYMDAHETRLKAGEACVFTKSYQRSDSL